MARVGVREQIVLISSVPLLFLVALLAVGFQLRSLSMQAAMLSQHLTDTLSKANRVYDSINDLFAEAKDYQKNPAAATIRKYHVSAAAIPGEITDLRRAVQSDRTEEARAKRFTDAAAAVVVVLDQIFMLEREHKMAAIAALSNRPAIRRLGPEYLASKVAFDRAEQNDSFARNSAVRTRLQVMSTLLVLITIAGIVVSLALAIRYGLQTGRRLRQLLSNAMLLARHEPTVPIKGDDEIAEVDRVHHEMSRELEETTLLQRALLPHRLPEVPGIRLDCAYVPAAMHGHVGGDWFDVFSITDDLLGISIGDVAGHGLSAAATMNALRQTIRVVARIEQQPSLVLHQVNRSLCADHAGVLATAIFGTLDCKSGMLRWSTAGHPSPIVVRPDRSVTFLDGEGLMLGVDEQTVFRDNTVDLDVGCALVLYTDGLVEVERDYLRGLTVLAEAALAEYIESSQSVASNVQRRVFSKTPPRDDSAILFVGISSLGATKSERCPVWHLDARDAYFAQRVKRALVWHLAGASDTATDFPAVELIYGELLANVARHTPGLATVTLEWQDDVPFLHVDDHGPPFELPAKVPSDALAETGRGFWLMSEYARELSVRRFGEMNRVSVALPVTANGSARFSASD